METNNNQAEPEQKPFDPGHKARTLQPLDGSLSSVQPVSKGPPPPSPSPAPVAPDNAAPAQGTPTPVVQNVTPATQMTGQYQASLPTNVGFSQSDALAQENKQKKKKRLFIGGGVLLALVVLGVVGFFAYTILFNFRTITYDNGRGDKFQLTFYSSYSVKAAPGSTTGLQELASKVSKNNLYPITITISKGSPQKPSASVLGCNGYSIGLQVTNNPSGNKVNLCSFSQGQTSDLLYDGVLQSGSMYYNVLITQDVNFQQILSNPQNAKTALSKIGLSAYNSDITKIVSSIKPLQ